MADRTSTHIPGRKVRLPGRKVRLPLHLFHALRDSRSEEEKWELIDGVPMMMPPPTLIHQRIARHLEHALNRLLDVAKSEWQAEHTIGILMPEDENWNPEPDVAVIDREVRLGQLYTARFYFVAEVLSESDKPDVIAAKRAFYTAHAPCRTVLFVQQERIAATLFERLEDEWRERALEGPDAIITFTGIGAVSPLGALYRDTPLDPVREP